MTKKLLVLALGASGAVLMTAQADEPPMRPLAPKAYEIGIAPSHITVPAEPMLTSSAEWPTVADRIDLYKYYGVQLTPAPWATPIDPRQLVAMAQREDIALGCEFGGFAANDKTGKLAIAAAFKQIDPVFQAGGKVASIHLDGPVRRQIKGVAKEPQAKSLEGIASELAQFYIAMHKKYPDMKVGLITNFPNWDYTRELPGVNGHFTDKSSKTYLQVLDAVESALRKVDQTIDFVEIDCPYNYYSATRTHHKDAAVDNAAKFRALHKWCTDRGIALHLIINAKASSAKGFHDLTLAYIMQLRRDGIAPDAFIIQSWYKHPEAQLPEGAPNTFMNTARDAITQIHTWFPAAHPSPHDGTELPHEQ